MGVMLASACNVVCNCFRYGTLHRVRDPGVQRRASFKCLLQRSASPEHLW